jgi:hypothetical protein
VVGAEVAGDGHQPGPEVLALPPEVVHRAQRAEEGLRGEVLGELARAGAVEEEAVDRPVVVVVEEAEGVLVAAAGQLDQSDQPGPLGLVLLRGGGQLVVAEGPRVAGDRGLAEQQPPVAASAPRAGGRGGRAAGGVRRGEGVGQEGGDGSTQGVEPACDGIIPLSVNR